jgi:probable phosphoglycerate mutase
LPAGRRKVGHIVIVPPARTEWTDRGRHVSTTEVPLTEEGEVQARELGYVLRRRDFARIICSPLPHAVHTAEIAGLAGRFETDPNLTEWDFGDYEGLTRGEIMTQRGGTWDLWRDGILPGKRTGETVDAVRKRAAHAIEQMREVLEAGQDVLLITHPQMMRAIAVAWVGLPHQLASALSVSHQTVSELGYIHSERAIIHWNSPIQDWPEPRTDPIRQWFA